jgi:hypothetical protein
MKITPLELPELDSELNVMELSSVEELPEGVEVTEVMQGLKVWHNAINGFCVARLHYTSNPAHRSPEWKETERKKYGISEWNREYELIWEAIEGRPVYADNWDPAVYVSRSSLGWDTHRPICRGWDFGVYPACIFGQLLNGGRLIILREAIGEDIGQELFNEETARLSLEWFPGARFIDFVDPTGMNRFGSDLRSYVTMLASPPVRARRIVLGENSKVGRKKAVIDFLKDTVKGRPCYLVDPSCDMLIKGFNGGYYYPLSNKGSAVKPDPEKNIFSHIHDANAYLCSKIKAVSMGAKVVNIKEAGVGGVKDNPRITEAKWVAI